MADGASETQTSAWSEMSPGLNTAEQYLLNTTGISGQYLPSISKDVREQQRRLMLLALLVPPSWRVVLSACVCATVTVLGVPGNLLVIGMFWRKRQRNASNLYILVLSCLDCLVCGVFVPLLPVFISAWHVLRPYMMWLKRIWTFFMIQNSLFSLYLLDLIALDRMRTICQSLKVRISHNCAITLVVVGFIVCFILASVAFMLVESQVSLPLIKVLTVPMATGITIIILAYGRIFFFLCKQSNKVRAWDKSTHLYRLSAGNITPGHLVNTGDSNPSQNVTSSSTGSTFMTSKNPSSTDQAPTQKVSPQWLNTLDKSGQEQAHGANPRKSHLSKTALTLGVVTVIFLLTYLPVYIVAPMLNIKPFSLYTYAFNYVANPFIYYFMNKGFNAEVKKFCREKMHLHR